MGNKFANFCIIVEEGNMLIEWDKSFSIKNAAIDRQHQKMFEIANRVFVIFDKIKEREIDENIKLQIKGIIVEFLEYIKSHLKDEENYMESIKYPLTREHKVLHTRLIKEAKEILGQINDIPVLVNSLQVFMKDWLIQHILSEDILVQVFATKSLEVKEIHHSLELYTKICSLKKNIYEEVRYKYICACPLKEHQVYKSIHEELQSGVLLRCHSCKQPLVYYPKMKAFDIEELKEKFFKTAGVGGLNEKIALHS